MTLQAMFSHVIDSEWEERTLSECLQMVADGKAGECFEHDNYDDGRRNFHCTAPCSKCDK